jgi:NMD protein affecting ribosome stability and mRNA decay
MTSVPQDNRDDHDRCCCECGDHFDGSLEDDYCAKCFAKLPPLWRL